MGIRAADRRGGITSLHETTAPEAGTGRILAEIEYVNYAWTPQFFGFFVDAFGDVYSYDREGTPWPQSAARVITEEELDDKFSLKRTLVTTVDTAQLRQVAQRIGQINEGQLSAPRMMCADAGALTYRVYKYNAGNRTYEPVLLRVEGDYAQQNTSQAAQLLIEYVRSLGLLEELLGCDP